jgi:hypothetical protein
MKKFVLMFTLVLSTSFGGGAIAAGADITNCAIMSKGQCVSMCANMSKGDCVSMCAQCTCLQCTSSTTSDQMSECQM